MRGPCARGTKAKARIQRDQALINREKFSADKGFTFEVEGRRLGGKILELHKITKNFQKGFASSGKSSLENSFPVLKDLVTILTRVKKSEYSAVTALEKPRF